MAEDAQFPEYADLQKRLGRRVKIRRKELGYRQEDLARGPYGLSRPTLQRIEYGTGNPTLLQLWKLSKLLETSMADLIRD